MADTSEPDVFPVKFVLSEQRQMFIVFSIQEVIMKVIFSIIKKFSLGTLFVLAACLNTSIFSMDGDKKYNADVAQRRAPAVMNLEMQFKIKGEQLNAEAIKKVEAILGYTFKDKKLLVQALTTREKDPKINYERFELLGDKVLDAVLIQLLLHEFKDANEGALTDARQALVSQEPMAALCLRLGLHEYLQHTKLSIPISTLCDVIESSIGALYEDGGEEASQNFVLRCFLPMIKDKKCPQMMTNIMRVAAKEARVNIEYVWKGDGCTLAAKSGKGNVTTNFNSTGKQDKKRLAAYLAGRDYITRNLDKKYQESLVRLAIDPDYEPLDKVPTLSIKWKLGEQENFRSRLHTLTQMLGQEKPEYDFQPGDEAAGARFVCTLDTHLCKPVTCAALTKNEAAEAVAEITYKEIQKSAVLTENTDIDAKILASLNMQNPISSLNEMCQSSHVNGPTYTSYFKPKNDTVAFYTCMDAPWLMTRIKGPVRTTEREARAGVAARTAALLYHCSNSYIEPKKLQLLCVVRDNKEPMGVLIRLCQCTDLEKPIVETHMCEGVVANGIQFETAITVADKSWGTKIIKGLKAGSKAEAEKDAAQRALNYVTNKIFKDELASAQA